MAVQTDQATFIFKKMMLRKWCACRAGQLPAADETMIHTSVGQ